MRTWILAGILGVLLLSVSVALGGGAAKPPPGLVHATTDPVLTAFKEQGVWYFPCVAPAYLCRIAPQPMTFGPPPPCGPPTPVCAPRAPVSSPMGQRKPF
jgi:hypothetical protein